YFLAATYSCYQIPLPPITSVDPRALQPLLPVTLDILYQPGVRTCFCLYLYFVGHVFYFQDAAVGNLRADLIIVSALLAESYAIAHDHSQYEQSGTKYHFIKCIGFHYKTINM